MLRFVPLVLKQVVRRRTSSLLTASGVALAMFLFTALRALSAGVEEAAGASPSERTLVVFREGRFCPMTSRMPERYASAIAEIAGVGAVLPVQIVLSNCRTGLDVVAFRGVPKDAYRAWVASPRIVAGSYDDWAARTDAALVGRALAERRGLRVGDRLEAAGVSATVAAIFESDAPQERNVAWVDLGMLQRSLRDGAGRVTQFLVRVDDPARLDGAAREIDARFRTESDPTTTRGEREFTARSAADVLELVRFGSWVAIGCAAAVLALVANAITLSMQDRVGDLAVLETLGFTGRLLASLIVSEAVVLSVAGGAAGVAAAVAVLRVASPNLTNEGLSIPFVASPGVWAAALATSAAAGVLAGAVPAWRVARFDLARSFRAV